MANNINNIKVTVGKETTPGTAVARTKVIPIRGLPTLTKSAKKERDPVIVGKGMASGNVLMSYDVAGGLPISFRPVAGVGLILKSLLGTEAAVEQIGAVIRIKFTGAEASCKLVGDTTGDTLKSYIGVKGSEALDSNFGTSGSIDLTALPTDTVAELVAVIDGYTDYSAELLDGDGAVSAADIIDITVQAKDGWAVVWFSSTTSGVYKHTFTPDLTNTERVTLSVQQDGFQDNYLYAGNVVDSFSLSAALQGMVEAEAALMGFTEVGGQTASALALEQMDPMVFANGITSFAGVDYTFVRSVSMEVKNNHQGDLGFGQGSLGRQANLKAMFEASGDLQLRLDAESDDKRPTVYTTDTVSLLLIYKGGLIGSSLYERAIIELPYVGLSETGFEDNGGTLDIRYNWEAFKPDGTIYNEPITIHLINEDPAVY